MVCPNVTIRDRLRELDPEADEASLYRTRDLVPSHLMPTLRQGRVLITNWHVFERQAMQVNGVSSKVARIGKRVEKIETITIGPKTTTARGTRYLTQEDFDKQVLMGLLDILSEEHDRAGNLKRIKVKSVRYVESDTALLTRVLGRDIGGKRNLLVMNDEAHHAYRIRKDEPEEQEDDLFGEPEEADDFFRAATVWIEGLDRIQKARGINFCLDLSATPYFLGRVGAAANRPFPWVVSDFGLIDAIESGLVKIPQLAVRDTTGSAIPGYFNIWHWILPQLSPAERGAAKASPKPEAILKYAHTPIAMLAGLWEQERQKWIHELKETRSPVFIIVCKNTQIARVVYEWLAENKTPAGIPPAKIPGFLNQGGVQYTIRVDSKVVHETDTGEAKDDATRWMRFTLDTVGKAHWPADRQGKSLYPAGFEELALKLKRPLHPPGRDVRCIVSVGMLTEGWDCNTVTHIVGLRPFMSQLLCEQVVGRGLRRTNYELGANGKFAEEVATIFGVPFEVIPFKANRPGTVNPAVERHYVHADVSRAALEIKFPRVEGYTQALRNRVTVDWDSISPLRLDPQNIPTEVQTKAAIPTDQGRPSLMGPGDIRDINLNPFRQDRRVQELTFDLARALTKEYIEQRPCEVPAHILFPQLVSITHRYLQNCVDVPPYADLRDVFLSPYYGWVVERLRESIRADTSQGEPPEIPRYDRRGPGSTAEVSFWSRRDVREVLHSHVNFVVADTEKWEQSAAYAIDTHPAVFSFVKNAGLGFAIPYFHNGQTHDYLPDFLIRFKAEEPSFLILETKGYDPLKEVKQEAALRWVFSGQRGRRLWRMAVCACGKNCRCQFTSN